MEDQPLLLNGELKIEESQLIINTSQNCIYENRLLVKGRYNGTCTCTVIYNRKEYFPRATYLVQQSIQITGMTIIILYVSLFSSDMYIVAGEPTNLIAESNSTHVTVSWKSPGDPITGYVIYYQSEGGGNSSDIVSGGETETGLS